MVVRAGVLVCPCHDVHPSHNLAVYVAARELRAAQVAFAEAEANALAAGVGGMGFGTGSTPATGASRARGAAED